MTIKDGYVGADTDGLIYRREDVHWTIPPDHASGDPGWLAPNPGAVPVSEAEATD